MNRFLSPSASKISRRSLLGLLSSVVLLTLFVVPARAIHQLPDSSFELDKDAVDNTSDVRDDWENVFNGTDSSTFDTGIVADPFGSTIYTTGGSKDDLDVNNWRHKSGSVPPKDEISDAYAAVYQVGDETRLYFGADRFANNGSSQIGFWFFQNTVSLNSGGTFSGVHVATGPGPDGVFCGDPNAGPTCQPKDDDDTPGDILILSDFTQGGAISTIRAFEWVAVDGTATANGTLQQVAAGVDCASAGTHPPAGTSPEFCGEVNGPAGAATDGTPSPWPYTPKFGTAGTFPFGSFYEGGIDLTAFGFGGVCFSSFLAETRSSPSVDATLKDFVLGTFPGCEGGIVTEPSDDEVNVGDTIHDTATVTTTGVGASAPQGFVTFYVCGPLAAGEFCTADPANQLGVPVALGGVDNPAVVDSDGFMPDAPGRWCFGATWTGDPNFDDDSDFAETECFNVVQIATAISTTQTVTLKDSATISATGGGNLAGSVHFRLYPNGDCSGATTLVDQTVGVSGASPQTVETTPITIIDPGEPVLSWLVEYTSTNPAQTGSSSSCATENASLDIDDGVV
jgi:hypothetical protein